MIDIRGVGIIFEKGEGQKQKKTWLNEREKLENPPPSQNFYLGNKIFNNKANNGYNLN